MPRYVTRVQRSRGGWDDDIPLIPNLQVDESTPQETGLLDKNGDPLYRLPDPIGFGHGKTRG